MIRGKNNDLGINESTRDFQSHECSGAAALPVEVWPDSSNEFDQVIEEEAIALAFNGISYAVMMATPIDLEAFITGFAFTEGIINNPSDIFSIDINHHSKGIEVNATLNQRQFNRLKQRRKNLQGTSGCGLCGIESLSMLERDIPALQTSSTLFSDSVQRALQQLHHQQPLQQLTGGAHAANWCNSSGDILYSFEDIGRHNALDKLIGHLLKSETRREGFVLMTSRISFELVQKAAVWGAPVIVGISAPTSKAIKEASEKGMGLIAFSRPDRQVVYSHGKQKLHLTQELARAEKSTRFHLSSNRKETGES